MSGSKNVSAHKLLREFLRSTQLDTDRSYTFEMMSPSEVRICGVIDVKNYDEDNLLVVSREVITQIRGNKLNMCRFTDCEVFVSGDILQINFIKR